MDENLLEVNDLTITPAGTETPVLQDVSLSLAPGERVGLIGESGSGKSLTAQSVMGLLPEELRAEGTVSVQGFDGNVLTAKEKTLARMRSDLVSMVFQEPMSALNPLMRIGAQIAEVLRIHGEVARGDIPGRVLGLLTSVHMPDPNGARYAYPHQLSGGQRQRVMLAIALANSPRLLICDEPTTALDVTVQRHMLDLIAERVAAVQAGLLFITHDLAVVAGVCDRVIVMYAGRIVETGSVAQIFTDPQHEYTRGLLASSDLEATDARGKLYTLKTALSYAGPAGATAPAAEEPADVREPAPASAGESDTAAETASLIDVTGVSKHFRARGPLLRRRSPVRALDDISFSVAAGQRLGIVGESGSGKSTLLTILSGLDRPTSGQVRVGDVRVESASSAALRSLREDLQIVFQDPFASLDPRMRVEDIVSEPLVARGMVRAERLARVEEMLLAVDLDSKAMRRYPHQFSGGQRQRISIARALVTRPQILVADEPVSALDVSVRAQVLNLLTDLVDDYALTLLFVSHDLGVVKHLCSDVIVMKDGHIVESGSTDDIYANPREDYTRSLIAATPSLAGALASAT
ncbi:MAG: ABC transporter ATP-binding protein [Brevibacterium sp.]|uniref:dipeptide ABC transporter ATP-binding protein n=1 Tax=Brevibacterium sp. TaxID=1701 RepID=UPI0026496CEB|nr:ABC transporter ATP-binding protein [Brevibacterium sp.]MDN5805754.1 ABC transporter ATP-binding protein [Brevibacterium sp.]MDN5834178.1 ABC transporter ATP-binding protein [Brevibacterium sp.]MDN5909219.1 ABC transporter ATP-binding protein [Brevibacterium sp.]MDN6133576.1 ABC transporter ATP-binding protein [Brevibacterium sp.]MDN6156503.1 ABC transporter ATP-binding protein [Brevibacterium sp.]